MGCHLLAEHYHWYAQAHKEGPVACRSGFHRSDTTRSFNLLPQQVCDATYVHCFFLITLRQGGMKEGNVPVKYCHSFLMQSVFASPVPFEVHGNQWSHHNCRVLDYLPLTGQTNHFCKVGLVCRMQSHFKNRRLVPRQIWSVKTKSCLVVSESVLFWKHEQCSLCPSDWACQHSLNCELC